MTEMERSVNQFDPDQYELARRLALRQQAAVGDLGIISMAAVTAGLTEPAAPNMDTSPSAEQPTATARQRAELGRVSFITTQYRPNLQQALAYQDRLAA